MPRTAAAHASEVLLRTHRGRDATCREGRHEQAAWVAASELGRQGARHAATSRASHASKPRRAGLRTVPKPRRGHGRAPVARAGLCRTPGTAPSATAELRPPWQSRAEVTGGRATPPRRAGPAQGHAEPRAGEPRRHSEQGGRKATPSRGRAGHATTAGRPGAPRHRTGAARKAAPCRRSGCAGVPCRAAPTPGRGNAPELGGTPGTRPRWTGVGPPREMGAGLGAPRPRAGAREGGGAPRAGEAGADRAGEPSHHGCAAERQDAESGLRRAGMPQKQGKRKKGRGGEEEREGAGAHHGRATGGGVGRSGGGHGSGVR
jgi:hypothetical protein